jgi:hypothetical protein
MGSERMEHWREPTQAKQDGLSPPSSQEQAMSWKAHGLSKLFSISLFLILHCLPRVSEKA